MSVLSLPPTPFQGWDPTAGSAAALQVHTRVQAFPCCVHIKAGRSLYTGVNLGCVDGMQGWGTVLSVTTPHPLSPTLLQGVGGWVSEQWLSPPSRSAHTPQNRFPSYASLSPPSPPRHGQSTGSVV